MVSFIWFYAMRTLKALAHAVTAPGRDSQEELSKFLCDAGLVMRHYQHKNIDIERFRVFEYLEGMAFVGPEEAVFWVKDGTVYVVHQASQRVAPDLPTAPPDVRAEDILQALDKGYYLL